MLRKSGPFHPILRLAVLSVLVVQLLAACRAAETPVPATPLPTRTSIPSKPATKLTLQPPKGTPKTYERVKLRIDSDGAWSNPVAKDLFKRRLRYIAARWAYSPGLWPWEWWNEINWTPIGDDLLAPWIKEMAPAPRDNDPYHHLISTSYSGGSTSSIRKLPEVDFVQQGKMIYVGSSNFASWDIATAQGSATAHHFLGPVSEQSAYSLNNRMIELEVIPASRAYGLGLIPYSPLGGGLQGSAQQKATEGRRAEPERQKQIDRHRLQLEAYEGLCRELGESPADVALVWLLHNPVVTAPIISPRTQEQFTGSLRALDIQLSPGTLARLDEIWPSSGGEAPKAYAW